MAHEKGTKLVRRIESNHNWKKIKEEFFKDNEEAFEGTVSSWRCMIRRTLYWKDTLYVERGMDPRWMNFVEFLKDVGPKPVSEEKYSIDRIDNNLGYFPGNVRWANKYEQSRNVPTRNRMVEFTPEEIEYAKSIGDERVVPGVKVFAEWCYIFDVVDYKNRPYRLYDAGLGLYRALTECHIDRRKKENKEHD